MLSQADVANLARAEGLGEHADDLVARVRPGWRIDPAPNGPVRIGGEPDLASGETWPVNERGIPMVFLAQIDCSALPEFEHPWTAQATFWDHQGRLVRLFADLMDNPVEPGPAIALACDPAAPLTRTPAPAIPDPWPAGGPWDDWDADERFHVLPETTARCTPFLTAPETHPVLHAETHQFDEQADRYVRWIGALRIDGSAPDSRDAYTVAHLLGHAASIQDDVREAATMEHPDDPVLGNEDAWEILLAIHMDDDLGIDIHDGGAFHILVPCADLASGTLDRLICDISSG